jgi:amino acid adenylation domain-containing protein
MEYLGRKDAQIKLRGQRLEPGEIEYHIKGTFPSSMKNGSDDFVSGVSQVSVDLLNTAFGPRLTAFFCSSNESRDSGIGLDHSKARQSSAFNGAPEQQPMFLPMTSELLEQLTSLVSALRIILPPYMVPSIFIPCRYMPFISSAKLDRKALKAEITALEPQQLAIYALQNSEKRAPETEMERNMQSLWADILNLPVDSIGREDSFLALGGDSINAINLLGSARARGIGIKVRDIFQDPRLLAVASKAIYSTETDEASNTIAPFSLLVDSIKLSVFSSEVRDMCELSGLQDIEDAYPCTTLQQGLIALSIKQPGSYIAKFAYKLSSSVNINLFIASWNRTVELCANLRTRIVEVNNNAVQMIINNDISWDSILECDLKHTLQSASQSQMTYGTRLNRYSLVKDDIGSLYFFWLGHHSIFDGWSLTIVMNSLLSTYSNVQSISLKPFTGFISYLSRIDKVAAETYWKEQLLGAQQASFPSRRKSSEVGAATKVVTSSISLGENITTSVTKATIVRAAWAIVLALYCDTRDITFGATVSGRQAPVPGLEHMTGPMIATVPIRVFLDQEQKVSDFLQAIQEQALDMVSYEQYGLQNIAKIDASIKNACDFSSLTVIQPFQKMGVTDATNNAVLELSQSHEHTADSSLQGYFTYPLVVQAAVSDEQIDLVLIYDSATLREPQVQAMSHQLGHVIYQLCDPQGDDALSSVSIASDWDLKKSFEANEIVDPEVINDCIHNMVTSHARMQPDAPAIKAWDGEFTYSELDAAATRLAHYLVSGFGIEPEELVHVCFEKSAWHFVSILAINKAGAAWVPLDPSHPVQRMKQIMKQTRAKLALTSETNAARCHQIGLEVIAVTPSLDEDLANREVHHEKLPTVTYENAAYVLFTSGSTGVPKGLVMEHGSACTSEIDTARRLGMTPKTRMLQFAAFVFDLSIGEIVGPLLNGACICVPSEHDRMNNLANFVRDTEANWAFLTPAFARTLQPDDFPSLELLLLAGEAVGRDVFEIWFGKLRFFNAWGPAETCCITTIHEWKSLDESSRTIGRPVGAYCWIVDPEEPCRLAPVGVAGEVVIQGPTLLREYLADPTKTEASMVRDLPDWVPRLSNQRWDRFYKSGDLCQYNADGTMEFVSRKDSQIKIRGLRVELGEVEHHIHNLLSGGAQVGVDVFDSEAGARLVAYVCYSNKGRIMGMNLDLEKEPIFMPMSSELLNEFTALVSELRNILPSYMVPSMFVPCQCLPFLTSAKLDRKTLNSALSSLEQHQMAIYALQSTEKRAPETDMERRLQTLWANILRIPADSIGRDDSFLAIGGDSISAIHLMNTARSQGISLVVNDIFRDPRLHSVAAAATESAYAINTWVTDPFELLDEADHQLVFDSSWRTKYGVPEETIVEDAYPLSPLQEGLMAMSEKLPGSYITRYFWKLPNSVELPRFQAAWEQTVQLHGSLRARVLSSKHHSVQVILQEPVTWEPTAGLNLESFVRLSETYIMGYGSKLARFALISSPSGGENYFSWISHHSMMDGWCAQLIIGTLHTIYWNEAVESIVPYSGFIKYISTIEGKTSEEFWAEELDGAIKASFPRAKSQGRSKYSRFHKKIEAPQTGSITHATMLTAAWSLILARYSNHDNVCFGATLSGRNAPIEGLSNMAGPAIATIPIRVHLDGDASIRSLLERIQHKSSETAAHEQYGLQNIAKVSPDAREACDFSSLMIIQPKRFAQTTYRETTSEYLLFAPSEEGASATEKETDNYFNYPLVVEASLGDDFINIRFSYQKATLSDEEVEVVAHQMEHVMQQLSSPDTATIRDISLVGDWEKNHMLKHTCVKPPTDTLIHSMVQHHIETHPEAPAVASWDGDLTYEELGAYSYALAHKLQRLGVGPETLVPLCFPKSTWTAVSMLAVVMAGGAFVPFDPSAPLKRLRDLMADTSATLILASPLCRNVAEELGNVYYVDRASLQKLVPQSSRPVTPVTPSNASFVIFTSGSTGKPKGMLHDHRSLCSAISAYTEKMNYGLSTRVFTFSAYTFDWGIMDVLGPLTCGSCICIPSDHERLNALTDTINHLRANWVFLTPTVANLLKPTDIPLIKDIGLGGEPITQQLANRWRDHNLHNFYGPSEATINGYQLVGKADNLNNIGKPMSSAWWIVEPHDITQLAPTGCVGELLIQGPLLARGYINADNNNVWLDEVDWLPGNLSIRTYRTGDLARRNADGTFDYVGRLDSQIKIHGQRVELGEIEAQIAKNLPDNMAAIASIIHDEQSNRQTLIALLWYTSGVNTEFNGVLLATEVSDETHELISHLNYSLSLVLTTVMIPSSYMVFHGEPERTASGKVDRKKLHDLASKVPVEDRLRFSSKSAVMKAPQTEVEFQMRDLWSGLLNIPVSAISRGDSFLKLGGDSITAIRLVSSLQERGFALTVANIFKDARLEALAAAVIPAQTTAFHDIPPPFSLLPKRGEFTEEHLKLKLGLERNQFVQDAFPCTPSQEGLMALTVKQPGSYIAKHVFKLRNDIDIDLFISSWNKTVRKCTSLRTRIVNVMGIAIQIIIDEECEWDSVHNLDFQTVIETSRHTEMTWGSRLNRFNIAKHTDDSSYFVWLSHHSIFDGWSLSLVMKTLFNIYYGLEVPALKPYSCFFAYISQIDKAAAEKYWKHQLLGAQRASFPPRRSPNSKSITKVLHKTIELTAAANASVTKASIIRAAWAIILARYCNADDVTFAVTASGRQASVQGIDAIAGPMIAPVPVRVHLNRGRKVSELLQSVQDQAIDMIPYEQFGLQNISKIDTHIKDSCDFSSLLVVQPVQKMGLSEATRNSLLEHADNKFTSPDYTLNNYFSYPLVVEAVLADDMFVLELVYDAATIQTSRVEALIHHFDQVIRQVTAPGDLLLSDVSIASSLDLEKAAGWNHAAPALESTCVHGLMAIYTRKGFDNGWAGKGNNSPATSNRHFQRAYWLVDPSDPQKQTPLGCVGELVIQSRPCTEKHCVSDLEQRQPDVIDDLAWIAPDQSKASTKFYRTGDLARYNSDGSLEYIGPKDSGTKANCQQVELGVVEYHIAKVLPEVSTVVVDMLPNKDKPTLAAFIGLNDKIVRGTDSMRLLPITEELRITFLRVSDFIAFRIPEYIAPKYYIPIANMSPDSSDGDIRGLAVRELLKISESELQQYSIETTPSFRECSDETERLVRSLWARVLELPESSIGTNDDFYRLGGDSMSIVVLDDLIFSMTRINLSLELLNCERVTISHIASFIRGN